MKLVQSSIFFWEKFEKCKNTYNNFDQDKSALGYMALSNCKN